MNKLRFNSPIPPSVNHYLDKSIRNYGRGYKGINFNKSEDALVYEFHMRNLYHELKKSTGWVTPPEDKFFKFKLTYFFYKKGMDPDNTFKLLFDCMTKNGIIPNDSNVIIEIQDIYIDAKNPRVEVEMEIIEKMGIFKNEEQYNLFIDNNCKNCKRHYYKKPCGSLNKYLKNYITEHLDIKNMVCKNKK